ncbi:helix-turn-helix domain-containing protein [Notoacmeibacter ruber]|uniref:AraC family transcriptional regulator n=1 Tax=Notoacmeibacter ruber TaxID=2670375 RepID=A0A3L7JG37_9HYPH|nr:AraC family transcriptional regulator [Notoacmeibacter ruber]RLQ89179.1 AraC family transcriptional regulator [Notoacmeibacter ruber]
MNFLHSMTTHTEGIRPTRSANWRSLDGIVGVFWDAEGETGARGYYLSPDPRILFFFNDISSHIGMASSAGVSSSHYRPMSRAIYVPPGMPLWTSFSSAHRFSHLDIHLHRDRLIRFLSPSFGRAASQAILQRPAEVQDVSAIEALARLLVEELRRPGHHPLHAENLVGCIVTGLLDLPEKERKEAKGRLTQAQMNRLCGRLNSQSDHRLSVAEMAETVGLSESWFATVFKETTGQTPSQWQLANRIDRAKDFLRTSELTIAVIAAQLGFSDQAHLTNAFRQTVGETPAAWRRAQKKREH